MRASSEAPFWAERGLAVSGAPFVSGQTKGGTVDDLRAWTMRQEAVGRCLFCPDWSCAGTIEEIELKSAQHRAEKHPEVLGKKRKRRANLSRWRSRLDEDSLQEISQERTRRMRLLGISEET